MNKISFFAVSSIAIAVAGMFALPNVSKAQTTMADGVICPTGMTCTRSLCPVGYNCTPNTVGNTTSRPTTVYRPGSYTNLILRPQEQTLTPAQIQAAAQAQGQTLTTAQIQALAQTQTVASTTATTSLTSAATTVPTATNTTYTTDTPTAVSTPTAYLNKSSGTVSDGTRPDGTPILVIMPLGYTATSDSAPITSICGAGQFYDLYGDGKCYMNTMTSIYTTTATPPTAAVVNSSRTNNTKSKTAFIGNVNTLTSFVSNFCQSPITIANAISLQSLLTDMGMQSNFVTTSRLLVLSGNNGLKLNLDYFETSLIRTKAANSGYWWDGSLAYGPTGTNNGQIAPTGTTYPYKQSDWTNPKFQATLRYLQLAPTTLDLCLDNNYVSNFPQWASNYESAMKKYRSQGILLQ
jgi:hypothetical protein